MDSIRKNLWHSRKKSVFPIILGGKICILPNSRVKKSVYTDKICMSGRSEQGCHRQLTIKSGDRLEEVTILQFWLYFKISTKVKPIIAKSQSPWSKNNISVSISWKSDISVTVITWCASVYLWNYSVHYSSSNLRYIKKSNVRSMAQNQTDWQLLCEVRSSILTFWVVQFNPDDRISSRSIQMIGPAADQSRW